MTMPTIIGERKNKIASILLLSKYFRNLLNNFSLVFSEILQVILKIVIDAET